MARQPKLALGTASFGMDYGVDKNGLRNYKVELHQVGKILSMAGLWATIVTGKLHSAIS